MRKSGIKAVIIATALAMTVTAATATTVTAKKKAKKTVVKLVNLDTAARKYVNKANASANKKKGTTSLKVSVKGSVSEGKFKKAVKAIHCKGLKSGTKAAFNDEVLCPVWSKLSVEDSGWYRKSDGKYVNGGKYTTFKVKFNNKKMHEYSSYGKVNYMKQAEKEIYNTLAIFEKDFGRKLTKAELGTFAVGYCGDNGGLHFDGNGGRKHNGNYVTSCAKGISEKGTKGGTNCMTRANAATRVMRILGFKENECGIVANYATNHDWNWWKVSGTIYVGDPSNMGAFFVDDKGKEINPWVGDSISIDAIEVGWGCVVENFFKLPEDAKWKYLGYESYEAYNEYKDSLLYKVQNFYDMDAYKKLDTLDPTVDFETFTKYQPICGLRTITEEECAKVIKKTGNIWNIEPSDGKKGTKWKHSTIHF